MFYFKAPGRCLRSDSPATAWGDLTRYMEVADDQFAVRQVEVFGNDSVLRYDRDHWCDAFGQLLGCRFSRKPKWAVFFPGAEIIREAEFEGVWRVAQRSPLWRLQVALSRATEWGTIPFWLR